jgi:hypothetical protein
VELDIQRFIRRQASGDSLIEPKPYLFLVFGVLGLVLLLRPSRDSQDATAGHGNDADYAPHDLATGTVPASIGCHKPPFENASAESHTDQILLAHAV